MNQVFANIFIEQTKNIEENQPYEEVKKEDKSIYLKIKGKKIKTPSQHVFFLPPEAVKLINQRINELSDEVIEKYGPLERILQDKSYPKYVFNFLLFPYLVKD